jgi:hypothetical protein
VKDKAVILPAVEEFRELGFSFIGTEGTSRKRPREDEVKIRTSAYLYGVPIITTAQGVLAAADGVFALKEMRLG